MTRRRTILVLLLVLALLGLLPVQIAAAAVTVTGTVSSPIGVELSGDIRVREQVVDDEGHVTERFVSSATVTDGQYTVMVPEGEPEGQYFAEFYLEFNQAVENPDFVSFPDWEWHVDTLRPVLTTVPMQPVTVDLTDAAGAAAHGQVSLYCTQSGGDDADGRESRWTSEGAGEVGFWAVDNSDCTVAATYDGITKYQDLYVFGPASTSMVLDSYLISGELDVPVGSAREVHISAHVGSGQTSTVTLAPDAESYQLRVPSGRQLIAVRAETPIGEPMNPTYHSFSTSSRLVVDGDQTVDFMVPTTTLDVDLRDAGKPRELRAALTCGNSTTWLVSEAAGTEVTLQAIPTLDPIYCNLHVYDLERTSQLLSEGIRVELGRHNRVTAYVDTGAVIHGDPAAAVDADGVDAQVEALGPYSGDGNNDGIFDYHQDNVTTLPMNGAPPNSLDDGAFVTVAAQSGTTLQNVRTQESSSLPTPPAEVTGLPAGLLSFELAGIPAGSDQRISIYTPYLSAMDYAKYDPGSGWYLLPRSRVESSYGLTIITLTDGGPGDADGAPNGTILDPGGIANVNRPADTTPPTVTGTVFTEPTEHGWYSGDVTVDWAAGDNVSTVSDPPDTTVTGEGDDLTAISQQVCDDAGNCASGMVTGLKIDRTPPLVDLLTSENYILGAVGPLECSATDALAGVAGSCAVGTPTGGNANGTGTFGLTASAEDKAGNVGTTTGSYSVHYRFDGFLDPINDPRLMPTAPTSVFKRNSTVSVALRLRNAAGQTVSPGSAPRWVAPVRLASTAARVNESVSTARPTTGSAFQLRGDRWQYNWSTKGVASGYTYRIGARLDDGTTQYVTIALR